MTNYNFMQPWLDYQKKFLDYWQQSVNTGDPSQGLKSTLDYVASIKPLRDTVKEWVDVANDTYTQNLSQAGRVLPQYHEFMKKLSSWPYMDKDLKSFWEDLNQSITDRRSDPFNLYSRWSSELGNFIPKHLIAFLPDQIRPLFDKTLDLYAFSKASAGDFFKPWLDRAQSMHNLLLRSFTGDQSAYFEFVKLWQESFAASFGKMANIPQYSVNRENLQTQMSSVNAMITFINTLNEYIAALVKTSRDTLEKLIIDYQAMVVEGSNPKSYKEFYDYWWKQNETAYLHLFSTPEFAKLSAHLLEAGCNYKKNYDDLMERQLEFLPYPTRTDMDSLYKTVDTLKRDLRTLKKDFEGLKKYVADALEED